MIYGSPELEEGCKVNHSWFFDQHTKYFKLATEQLNGSQDDRARARASEFANNNFNNQDFSSVDSD